MDAGAVELALFGAALLVGATGTWSPCGFSMVETLGPNGHTGGRGTTIAACLTFLPGALAGAVATFTGLALAGELIHGAGGAVAYGAAALLAVAAAALEARGAPILPQVRRQLPEHWRRVMPMPVASALYGVLLGLGFTTFILSFGVWALAGISLALGLPAAGLAIGIGFGLGRALPIVALAPIADLAAGRRALTAMAERPGIYRAVRVGDSAVLLVAAAALVVAASTTADADVRRESRGADPAVWKGDVVYQVGPERKAQMRGADGSRRLPGTDPAIGGPWIAVIDGRWVVVLNRESREEEARFEASGVDAVSVGIDWIAYRTRRQGDDAIHLRPLADPADGSAARTIARASYPAQLSRPSVAGARVAFATANSNGSRIQILRIGESRRTVVRAGTALLTNPSLSGRRLLYVRTTADRRDRLHVKELRKDGSDRILLSRSAGHIWSTALTGKRAYVTILSRSAPRQRVFSVWSR